MVEHALDDVALMRQVVQGDHAAFAKLVTRHTQKFYMLAYRTVQHQADAEDIVQTAFVKLWQRPKQWQADKAKFTTWFYRVVLNACHDHLRSRARTSQFDEQQLDVLLEPVSGEQDNLEQSQHSNWQCQCLETAIRRLPASQRDALNLVVYNQLPQKQVADILGVSVKAVESLLVRAKRSIRLVIEDLEQQRKREVE